MGILWLRRGLKDLFRANIILNRKDISELAVVALGPDMSSGGGLDQLRRHPHAVGSLAHTAFQDIPHTEFSADILDRSRLAFVGEARIAGDHEQRARLR